MDYSDKQKLGVLRIQTQTLRKTLIAVCEKLENISKDIDKITKQNINK